MQDISIQFTRFSAFYSPLIATIAGGFLEAEGLRPKHSVSPPGKSAIAGLVDGSVHVAQSAPSQAITALEHHGGQPTVMFQYACHKRGLDYAALRAIDAGAPDKMIAAFKSGEGEYIHLQGPAPQQLERDGHGHIVAALGDAIGPCAFSSLAATREWLTTDMAKAFMRAYRKGRAWLIATPAAEVAKREAPFFPDIHPRVLEATIAAYQKLGNWSPHVEITRAAFEATLDIYQHAGKIKSRPRYEDAIAQPPA
jgi:NitT/TauT family transport system substrate-binding protein